MKKTYITPSVGMIIIDLQQPMLAGSTLPLSDTTTDQQLAPPLLDDELQLGM